MRISKHYLAALLILAGIGIGASMQRGIELAGPSVAHAQPVAPPAGAVRWQYHCLASRTASHTQTAAAELGQQYWEMVGAWPSRQGATLCFKRPAP